MQFIRMVNGSCVDLRAVCAVMDYRRHAVQRLHSRTASGWSESLIIRRVQGDGLGRSGGAHMGTHIAPFEVAERELAAAELEYIALTAGGSAADVWKQAVLEWHCEAIAKARAEAWIPGLARSQDQRVEKVLKRFYHHRIGVMLRALKTENLKLRGDLINALRRVRLHQKGAMDVQEPERSIVEGLQSSVM